MYKKSHFILVLLLSFTLISTASCKQGVSSDYQVLESGYNAFKKTHWIDNNRVIFSGYPSGLPKNNDQRGIYIWNTKTSAVNFLGKSEGGLCYNDGYVHYYLGREIIEQNDEGMTTRSGWAYGLLGKEKEDWKTTYTLRGGDPNEDRLQSLFNEHDCKIAERPPELKDHRWRPLKPEHGYLDYGLRDIKERRKLPSVLYYLPDGGQTISLPVDNESWLVEGYSQYHKAYKLIPNTRGNVKRWEESGCYYEFYLLFPNGDTKRMCTPYKNGWERGTLLVYPMKSSLFLVSRSLNSKGRAGTAGGYRTEKNKIEKLIDGVIDAVSVSPDGCKAAFAVAKNINTMQEGYKLKIINLCKGKGE